jgi:hypothetical protein
LVFFIIHNIVWRHQSCMYCERITNISRYYWACITTGLRLNCVWTELVLCSLEIKEKNEYNAYIANLLSKCSACVAELSRLCYGKYQQQNFWSFVQLKTPRNEWMPFADISGLSTNGNRIQNEHCAHKANATNFDRYTHVIHPQWQWDRAII